MKCGNGYSAHEKNQSKNRLIFKITMDMIIYYFYVIGDIVIYDATNIIPCQRKNVVKYLAYKGFSPNIYCIYLDTTPEIAKDRNRARDEEERVPDSVIDSMAQRFTPPTATEEFNGQYIFQDIYKIYPETLDNSVDIVYDILTKQRER